jgi:hypothetical protein
MPFDPADVAGTVRLVLDQPPSVDVFEVPLRPTNHLLQGSGLGRAAQAPPACAQRTTVTECGRSSPDPCGLRMRTTA